jgi:hypothetical protein
MSLFTEKGHKPVQSMHLEVLALVKAVDAR